MDQRHNPEFTLLELYEAYTDIHGMMDITEGMFRHVANKVCGTGKITFDGVDLDLDKPFERISMVEAVRKYAGVDFDKIETLDEARAVAKEHHIEYEQRHKKGDILNLFIEAYVEDKLVQPTFLTGHPVEISPLAKRDPDHPGYTQRFELFINGREYANAFRNLTIPSTSAADSRLRRNSKTGRRRSQRHRRRLSHRNGIRHAPDGRIGRRR